MVDCKERFFIFNALHAMQDCEPATLAETVRDNLDDGRWTEMVLRVAEAMETWVQEALALQATAAAHPRKQKTARKQP